jgi:hypothetical protein
LHNSTFEYLKPTDEQLEDMQVLRNATFEYYKALDDNLPEGADKTYIIRKLREIAMWNKVAITREADGTPRGR